MVTVDEHYYLLQWLQDAPYDTIMTIHYLGDTRNIYTSKTAVSWGVMPWSLVDGDYLPGYMASHPRRQ
jgi:hypothetical protein